MSSARLALSLLLLTQIASAQTFEAVSIRPSGPKSVRGSDGGPGSKDPTRYTFDRAELLSLILLAYGVENFQVSSKLPLDREEFDLTATIAPGATKDDFRIMMQNLLADRFQMQLHNESRDFPAFELIAAKGGTKLGTDAATKLAASPDFPQLTPGKSGLISSNTMVAGNQVTRIRGQQQPVSQLARFLRFAHPLPVVDRTGLTGTFDFTLQFAVEPLTGSDSPAPSNLPDLNTALRDQLGLQLVAKKLPFDVIVVESFNRLPSGN